MVLNLLCLILGEILPVPPGDLGLHVPSPRREPQGAGRPLISPASQPNQDVSWDAIDRLLLKRKDTEIPFLSVILSPQLPLSFVEGCPLRVEQRKGPPR